MSVLQDAIEIVPGADLVLYVTRYAGTQLLTLTGGATGGTFTLSYRNQTTTALAYNASAAAVQAALEALTTVGSGNVTVSGSAGGPWTVTPQGTISPDVFVAHLITGNTGNLTGGSNYRLVPSLPTQDVHTGYTYEFQARDVAGETTPDVQIDATHTTQGTIDVATSGASGIIIVTVNRTATAALDFSTSTTQKGYADFVLMETVSSVRSPLLEGRLHLKGKVFV